MKKVARSLLLILIWPFRVFKKSKIDNFIGGLIFGAVFSLVVNIVTVHIQEIIQKQHILEAVENEITNNTLRANYISQQNQDSSATYNPFYTIQRYNKDIWEQSSEPLQYISQLDQQTQIIVMGYYTTTVPLNNGALGRIEKITDEKLIDCAPLEKTLSVAEKEKCATWNNIRLELEKSTAMEMAKQGFEVMKAFHPTKDRLNNWFLRLIMGNKSTRILSGE